MTRSQTTKVAILGAGKGGTALLELLHQMPDIDIVGIADKDPRAPGLARARALNIPTTDKIPELITNHGVNLIMDVTGDPELEQFVRANKRFGAELLSGSSSRLLWTLVQHEAKLQGELFHAEKLAGIGSFATGIAHDINNPLQLILGLAENLQEEQDLPTVHAQAKEIAEAVQRTSSICKDLTRYARRSGPDEASPVDLNVKLDEALKIAQYAAVFQDITVAKHYDPGATVSGNPDALLHVFVNLITNAVQAMVHGGNLTLETRCQNNRVTVLVSDTGCGIPPESLPHIFDPFFTTKPPGKGTGLGLYNVRAVITKMQGTIHVVSQVGRGTTFLIEFAPPSAGQDKTPL